MGRERERERERREHQEENWTIGHQEGKKRAGEAKKGTGGGLDMRDGDKQS